MARCWRCAALTAALVHQPATALAQLSMMLRGDPLIGAISTSVCLPRKHRRDADGAAAGHSSVAAIYRRAYARRKARPVAPGDKAGGKNGTRPFHHAVASARAQPL